tara:strand:+ start:928 stop:1095 length:168 start_codon:yes stop_codon:yes gene_type:complete
MFEKIDFMELFYEIWYDKHIDELRIKWSENGADREMDFDEDREIEMEFSRFKDTL